MARCTPETSSFCQRTLPYPTTPALCRRNSQGGKGGSYKQGTPSHPTTCWTTIRCTTTSYSRTTRGLGRRAHCFDLLWARTRISSACPVDRPRALPCGECAGHGWHGQVRPLHPADAPHDRALRNCPLSFAARCSLL